MMHCKKVYSIIILGVMMVFMPFRGLTQETGKETAVNKYLELLSKEGPALELYFNLGNAYLREDNLSSAIYYYLHAHKIDPQNGAVLKNLEIARNRLEDPLIQIPDFFLIQWWKQIRDWLAPNAWAFISLVFFLLIPILVYFQYYRQLSLSRRHFVISLLTASVFAVFTMLLSIDGKSRIVDDQLAVVFTQTTMKSGPDNRSDDVKILYEGYTLEVLSELEGWLKVKTRDLEVGWVLPQNIKQVQID